MFEKANKNCGSAALECAISVSLLLGVICLVTVQDIMTLNQTANDARKSVASLYLANEGARVRNSLSPGQDGSYIAAMYPATAGTTITYPDTPLAGTNAPATGELLQGRRIQYRAMVKRTLTKTIQLQAAKIVKNSYNIQIEVPQIKGKNVVNEIMTRDFVRSFHDNSIVGP